MLVQRIINSPVNSNCFVLYESIGAGCIIIDPGSPDNEALHLFMEQKKLTPQFVILTHEHFDHIWGVNLLKTKFECKLICSETCAKLIIDRKRNMSIFYDQNGFEVSDPDLTIESLNNQLEWNGNVIELIETRGHSKGSICIYINNCLFTGDTLIKDLKTVIKLPGGSVSDLRDSIKFIRNKYLSAKPGIYPGHGDCFVLNENDLITAIS